MYTHMHTYMHACIHTHACIHSYIHPVFVCIVVYLMAEGKVKFIELRGEEHGSKNVCDIKRKSAFSFMDIFTWSI